jgi:hypothetical protein
MDKKYNPIRQKGTFEVSGFAGVKTVEASSERGAKWQYMKQAGKSAEFEDYTNQLTVKEIHPTEYIYG